MSLVYGTTSAEAWIAYVIYLAKSSRKEVRNPKDIIFGFIGMVSYITQMQGGKETHTKDLFDIHYTMDLDRLYAHFTAQILLKVPHLAILSLTSPDAASGHDRLSRTWIPAFPKRSCLYSPLKSTANAYTMLPQRQDTWVKTISNIESSTAKG